MLVKICEVIACKTDLFEVLNFRCSTIIRTISPQSQLRKFSIGFEKFKVLVILHAWEGRFRVYNLPNKGRNLCVSVCISIMSRPVHPIDLTRGGCVACSEII